jgi:hypothetical protein
MKAKFNFHGIGQGLFYSGKLSSNSKTFSFVYDCGTLYKKDYPQLEYEIKNMQSQKIIDILFVSHFDIDHISGLPCLLDTYDVKYAFIPHITQTELALLAIHSGDSIDSELMKFYKDPAKYFLEHNCKLFIIHPPRDFTNERGELQNNIEKNDLFSYFGDTYSESDDKQVIHCSGTITVSLLQFEWEFALYQDQNEAQHSAIVSNIEKFLPFPLDKWHIMFTDILKDKGNYKAIQECYTNIMIKCNQSSQVLLHYPTSSTAILSGISNSCNVNCYGSRYCGYYCSDKVATLMTGDIDLCDMKNNGNDFTNFISNHNTSIIVMQLPHHGSKNNVSVNLLKLFLTNDIFFVCTYGRGNQYRHPDAYMLDEIMVEFSSKIKHVVSKDSFCYFITD